ncbi:alpha-hydroxy acid oxidase [Roseomonas sp. E05]|uniref:alpha-hydroxy acid oxidase n=1 Tax=Roseomonas sp. E05 TaxID=3046310 RepID=UPI0024BA37AB|nr:alpha-hydroxy acid oxidase [Roseomonas sp. E05]MDJ0391179.1 alpha-hydroxy acid oxidase [Roseomonas sp. E05]
MAGAAQSWGSGGLDGRAAELRRRYPCVADLEQLARRRIPRFAYDFVAGGVGGDHGLRRNRAALDAVQLVPRYGRDVTRIETGVTLFGRDYALPVGVAPMGLAGLAWPGIDEILAAAAQRARIPYVSSTVANAPIERLAALAPDVFWFQLYGLPGDDHAVSLELVRRAERAGAHVLVLTMDVPARQKREGDVRNGLAVPFRPRLRTVLDVLRAPRWGLEVLRRGQPRFENFCSYVPAPASTASLAGYTYHKMAGPLTWEAVARLREAWPRALVVKGILHPEDAERAVRLGVDGVLVSNHGGRQSDAAPASIDALPAIAARVAGRATLLLDSGVRCGLDVLRALALGADAVLAGRAFLYGGAALGAPGADHVAALFREEIRGAMALGGVTEPAALRETLALHPGAIRFPAAPRPALAETA